MKAQAPKESVWDYPRPPRLESVRARVQVVYRGVVVADTQRAQRVLETSHPPNYYIPAEDVRTDLLHAGSRTTVCEWKGLAHYFSLLVDGHESKDAAWSYPNPNPDFAQIANFISFYPGRVDRCLVSEEEVRPEHGQFYGGWITDNIEL